MCSSETAQSSDTTGGRKLIAVLYADMVGYSRLIGLDDAGTLQRLKALRANLIDPAIQEHGGKIVQTGGDSLLVIFDSVDGAVRCAVKVQERVPTSMATSRLIVPSAFALESTSVTRLPMGLTCTGTR